MKEEIDEKDEEEKKDEGKDLRGKISFIILSILGLLYM
jgi:hypothetical protein